MRKSVLGILLLCFSLLGAGSAFAQGGNGAMSGTIQDASKGLLPGVTITLTNTGTGVVNIQITNESGIYNFPVVPPGAYNVTASLPGFRTSAQNGVQITQAAVRINFTLEVGSIESRVDVVATTDTVLSDAGASVGTVLPQQRVTDLPLVGQNVLSLLDVLPGFRAGATDASSTIGGLSLDYTNTTINGLSTVSSRDSASTWGRQVMTTNVINPDLVGEIRLILSPVDAELGRGNSQVQIQTRSGTNKYNGTVSWNVQNSALNAYTWASKRNNGTPPVPLWYNLNQVTGSYGGPIIRNKTFFFALYDKQLVNRREEINTSVLTDSARQGIWRYWEGWNPAAAGAADPTSFVSATTQPTGSSASVNYLGNPVMPNFTPTGNPYATGGSGGAPYGVLRCISIYGNKKVTLTGLADFTQADCPGGTAIINSVPWDQFRTTLDSTGYISKILKIMPHANYFQSTGGAGGTDGLNTATYKWIMGRKGPASSAAGGNAAIGVVNSAADYNNRSQINIKIDHNINSKNRVNVAWTWEKDSGDGTNAPWGTGLNGIAARKPQFITVNSTSTISSTLVNEGRFGANYSSEFALPPWENIDHSEIRDAAQANILYGSANPTNGRKYPVNYNPGANWNGFMAFGSAGYANYSPLYNLADTIRWSHGKHSISAGGEYRRPWTVGYNNSAYVGASPGNAGATATPLFFSTTVTNGHQLCGTNTAQCNFLAATRGNASTLLSTMYGAINAPTTNYWIDGQKDITAGTWQDVTTATNRFKTADPYGHQSRTQISNEWSFFLKDDYKLDKRLTLNIGLRYDFTGSPYLSEGLTNTLADDGFGVFGPSRVPGQNPFAAWLTPGNLYLSGYGSQASNTSPLTCTTGTANPNGIPTSNCNPDLLSKVIFVGPKTDHPDKTLVPENGAFSPALGLSWQLPWFGEGKTTIRGGFQRTYGRPGSSFQGGLVSGPGAGTSSGADNSKLTSVFATRAANLTDLPLVVPSPPTRAKPQDLTYRVGSRSGALSTYALYDPDFRQPHSDNWTLTVTRSLNRSFTLEVRAVNTLARDQQGTGGFFQSAGSFDINTINVYHNPEIFKALENTRAGLNDPLFDQMLMGLNLNTGVTGYGAVGTVVNGVLQRGSAHIRRAYGSINNGSGLANGAYVTVLNSLLGANTATGIQGLPVDPLTGSQLVTAQRVLRNGCDRLANGFTNGFVNPDTGATLLPRCFAENYLTANPQWNSGNSLYSTNLGHSDYNSVEVQLTMRPIHGLSMQTTYGFSKTMVQPGNGFTDPLNPSLDYGMSLNSVGHDLRSNGTFELPIGPNKLLLGNSSGILARAFERWQMGFIYSISSGAPRNFSAGNNMLYANGRPNVVGPWKSPEGKLTWNGVNGNYYAEDFQTYEDPQCTNMTTADNLKAACSLRGLAAVVPQGTPGAVLINATNNTYGIKLLENPQPGTQGNLGANTLHTFPKWRLDGNLSKTFRLRESMQAQLRLDATNIFNHPTPADATLGFNDNFGQITTKTGSRTFQAKLRVTF